MSQNFQCRGLTYVVLNLPLNILGFLLFKMIHFLYFHILIVYENMLKCNQFFCIPMCLEILVDSFISSDAVLYVHSHDRFNSIFFFTSFHLICFSCLSTITRPPIQCWREVVENGHSCLSQF